MKTCLWLVLIGWGTLLVTTAVEAQEAKSDKVSVRPLNFRPQDPTIGFTIGGQSKITRLADATAVEKLLGKNEAKGLIGQVDFKKEAIVLVSWTTAGPPEGILKHEVKKGVINFFVKGPNVRVRGQRARIGADFFAVPVGYQVTFDPRER
jgi:hypothetical protein